MKNLLAGVVGGIILVVWGYIAWAVVPLHKSSLLNLPNEDIIIETFRNNIDAEGVYVFPGMPIDDSQESKDAYIEKYKQGPMGLLIYSPYGSDPMMIRQFIVGLFLYIIAGTIAAWFLSRSTASASTYFQRVAFCGMFGVMFSFYGYISEWNWMGYPFNYSTAMSVNAIIGWILAGLGISAIVKARKTSDAVSQ